MIERGSVSLKQSRIIRSLLSVTGFLIFIKFTGLIKQTVTAGIFGITLETDLISLSYGLIGNLQFVLFNTLVTSFVAVYLEAKAEDDSFVDTMASHTARAFSWIAAGLVSLILIFAGPIARILAPTYSTETSIQLAMYLRIFSPLLIVFTCISTFQALLGAREKFVLREMEGLNQNLLITVLVLAFQCTLGVRSLVAGYILAPLFNLLFFRFCVRSFWTPTKDNPFHDPGVQQILRLSVPMLLGYAMVYINQQVDKILVSGMDVGSVTAMGYAAVLSNLVGTLLVSCTSVLFPYITSLIVKKNHLAAAQLAVRSSILLMAAFLPVSILTVICAKDVVSIVFGRGAFSSDAVRIASYALMGYAFSFVPQVLQQLFSRFQYGYQDTRRPMVNSTIGIVCNIVLSITLCPVWGIFGVTFASSVSSLICGILNILSARQHNAYLHQRDVLFSVPWLVAGGVVCTLIALWGTGHWASLATFWRFVLVTITSGGAYSVVVFPFVIKMLRTTKQMHST